MAHLTPSEGAVSLGIQESSGREERGRIRQSKVSGLMEIMSLPHGGMLSVEELLVGDRDKEGDKSPVNVS
jgi:hypothetical protein